MSCSTHQIAPRERGVVYPNVQTTVEIDHGNIECYYFTSNSCRASVTSVTSESYYTVTLYQTNEIGQVVSETVFDCKLNVIYYLLPHSPSPCTQ